MNEILETLRTNSPKIAVLGDSILDAYYVGFLRETQESIFIPQKRYYHLGGAGNVAYSIRRLGGTPLFIQSWECGQIQRRSTGSLRIKSCCHLFA